MSEKKREAVVLLERMPEEQVDLAGCTGSQFTTFDGWDMRIFACLYRKCACLRSADR